jgi:hypothetical protein
MSRFAGQGSSITIVERSGAPRYASKNCGIRQRFCGEKPRLRLHGVDQGRRNVTSLVTNLAARIRFVTSDVANLRPPSRVGQEERAEVAQIRGREAASKSRPEASRKLVDRLLAVTIMRVTLL